MKRLRIGQIGIGHNHGSGKMEAVRNFPELFEIVGYAEEDEAWRRERGDLEIYRDIPLLSVDEVIKKADAVLVECDVWNLTKYAKLCVDAGKHLHMDKPASGMLEEFRSVLDTARCKGLTVQMGYMYRYNPAVQKCMELVHSGELSKLFIIKFAEPVFAALCGALLIGENVLSPQYLLAFLLIAVGITISNLDTKRL